MQAYGADAQFPLLEQIHLIRADVFFAQLIRLIDHRDKAQFPAADRELEHRQRRYFRYVYRRSLSAGNATTQAR